MTKLKAKFELYSKLQELGFTFDEAVQLRRIEMTLQRWAEQECGDSNDRYSVSIEREEIGINAGKPYRVVSYHDDNKVRKYRIADREAGALRRLNAIVEARNSRRAAWLVENGISNFGDKSPDFVIPYHQTDCRGCMVYLVRRDQLGDAKIDQVYNRGLAVCC